VHGTAFDVNLVLGLGLTVLSGACLFHRRAARRLRPRSVALRVWLPRCRTRERKGARNLLAHGRPGLPRPG